MASPRDGTAYRAPNAPYNDLYSSSDDEAEGEEESFALKPKKMVSATAVLHDEEHGASRAPRRPRRRARGIAAALRSRPWLCFGLGFLTALVLSAVLVRNPGEVFPTVCPSAPVVAPSDAPSSQDSSTTKLTQGSLPATTNVSFAGTPYTFSAFPHKELNLSADEAWDALYSPPNQGMLYIADTTSQNTSSHSVLGVSMFHALHCLGMIRNLVTGREASNVTEPIHGAHGQKGVDDGVDDNSHVSHCFFYIAQTLSCGADGTLEPPTAVRDKSGLFVIDHAVDGDAHTHVCRDPIPLWEKVLESQETPFDPWSWQEGDSIWSVFGAGQEGEAGAKDVVEEKAHIKAVQKLVKGSQS